jgi:exoribonuclease II
MKDFGIIYLNDKCTTIDNKGNRYKKFKSIITNEEYIVKTKRTEQVQTYCIVNSNEKTILEYCDDINDDYNLIVEKLGLLNWSMKFDKTFNSTLIEKIDLTPDRKYFKGNIISIDPEGCKDIDDAIQIMENNNSYDIYIHISDPSSYIPINSPLDNEIKNRNSSIYLLNIFHMIPETLSTDIISLIEKKERRAYTCIIKISKELNQIEDIEFEFCKSNIIVDRNMSYVQFESEYKNNTYYKKIYDVGLKLYKILELKEEYDSHKMIEAYMILCNICASKKCIIKRATVGDSESMYNTITEYVLEDKEHKIIGFQYTHFTSPIRRYVDIMVHRLIYNKDSYNINELEKIIIDINKKNNILKKMYNIFNLLNIMNNNICIDIKAEIVYINNNNIKFKMIGFNKILNLYIDNRLIENNIIQLNNITDYKINQVVDLKIYYLKNELNPFKIVLNLI